MIHYYSGMYDPKAPPGFKGPIDPPAVMLSFYDIQYKRGYAIRRFTKLALDRKRSCGQIIPSSASECVSIQ